MLKYLLFIVSLAVVAETKKYACYAPPLYYGRNCESSTAVFGSPGLKITYSISQVNQVGTTICCEVLGCESANQGSGCRMTSVGCSATSITATVFWGNVVATPAISCYGTPFGTSIEWSH